jgi:anti-sigma regulatory factor (Ser/Thr protein kinase)
LLSTYVEGSGVSYTNVINIAEYDLPGMARHMDSADVPAFVLSEQTHYRLPTRPDWIETIVGHLKTCAVLCGACHESRAGKLLVALHEALSNAMIHGNLELGSQLKERDDNAFAAALARRLADPALAGRRIDVMVDYDGERCQWIITDQGKGFDSDRVLARSNSNDPDILLASGRGIPIMRAFLDEVRYELNGRRIHLTLRRQSGDEKRGQPRFSMQQTVRIVPLRENGNPDWDAAYDAVSRNISQEGLNLLQGQINTTRRLIIGLPSGKQWTFIPADVRHCRALAGNVVEIGCRFESGETAAPRQQAALPPVDASVENVQKTVDVLIDRLKLQPLPHDDRRKQARVAYSERLEVRCETLLPVVGFARNLSKGGIAFLATASLPLEDCIIKLPQPGGRPLGLRARILRCSRIKEGLYDVAASFLGLAA